MLRSRQRGVTFLGWVVLLIPFAVFAYAGLRATPVYLNYMKVARALEQLAAEGRVEESTSQAALRTALSRRFEVESIEYPAVESVRFMRENGRWTAEAAYEDVVPLFADISLLVKFDKRVEMN